MNLVAALARMLPLERPLRTATERAGGPSSVRQPLSAPPVTLRERGPVVYNAERVEAALVEAWAAWGKARRLHPGDVAVHRRRDERRAAAWAQARRMRA